MSIDKATLKELLKELEKSHLKPDNRVSSDFFEKLLADDFFEFGCSEGFPMLEFEKCPFMTLIFIPYLLIAF
ncbi:hypothetical protein SAMN04487943_1218 [Gracilibacillus orientalis]|uniref:Uncharacterized protein n=1 Tax=Gracilibacillus orientalis TaxID=334253 RepID=A0A1I4R5W8_9BACI|nr:hypothetical protein SAMN04487943_1218 [Gracilibacillus orientalis]